jgi:hypothetical protein
METHRNKSNWIQNLYRFITSPLTLGLRTKKTSYFYGTGCILYPYFLKYLLNIFFSRFDYQTQLKSKRCFYSIFFIFLCNYIE